MRGDSARQARPTLPFDILSSLQRPRLGPPSSGPRNQLHPAVLQGRQARGLVKSPRHSLARHYSRRHGTLRHQNPDKIMTMHACRQEGHVPVARVGFRYFRICGHSPRVPVSSVSPRQPTDRRQGSIARVWLCKTPLANCLQDRITIWVMTVRPIGDDRQAAAQQTTQS